MFSKDILAISYKLQNKFKIQHVKNAVLKRIIFFFYTGLTTLLHSSQTLGKAQEASKIAKFCRQFYEGSQCVYRVCKDTVLDCMSKAAHLYIEWQGFTKGINLGYHLGCLIRKFSMIPSPLVNWSLHTFLIELTIHCRGIGLHGF